jgi:hypothetical protein
VTGAEPIVPDGADEPRPPGAAAFAIALVTYVALGLTVKSVVLNWIVGPAYLVLTLHVLPIGVRRLRHRIGTSRR